MANVTSAWGADLEALRMLSRDLKSWSGELIDAQVKLAHSVERLDWFGPDSDGFRYESEGLRSNRHQPLIQALQAAAQILAQNADAQAGASAADGASAMGGVGLTAASAGGPTPGVDLGRVNRAQGIFNKAMADDFRGVTDGDLKKIQKTLVGLTPAERDALFGKLSDDQLAKMRAEIDQPWQNGGLSEDERRAFYQDATRGLSGDSLHRLLGNKYGDHVNQHDYTAGSDRQLFANELKAIGSEKVTGCDEIRVVALDDGTYVVSLPGVIDLSANAVAAGAAYGVVEAAPGVAIGVVKGLVDPRISVLGGASRGLTSGGEAIFNLKNSDDSVRDMKYAIAASRSDDLGGMNGENPYKQSVQWAMQSAGIPAGAKVKFIGHSFGAYTAAQLAADPTFNSASMKSGLASTGDYSVQVTHVLAAGADADWITDRVNLGSTKVLVINNKFDVPFTAESSIGLGSGNKNEVVFDGGFGADAGHHPDRYSKFLGSADNNELIEKFFEGSAASQTGQTFNLKVKDMYR